MQAIITFAKTFNSFKRANTYSNTIYFSSITDALEFSKCANWIYSQNEIEGGYICKPYP